MAVPAARNRLASSGSLYLRQHSSNPVHWQSWDDEAFALAYATGRPILLSIGYAACHWCHVMASESFADPSTAALMNELYVCIKVDREERPDLDRFYLSEMARLGKAAGWPLTAFLTPDAAVFEGGGYFPPEPRFGLPAFRDVLRDMAAAHRKPTGGDAVIAGPARPGGGDVSISRALLDRVARDLAGGIDTLYGGFGQDGPKFLHAAGHEMLLRAWHRTGDPALLATVATSVAHICDGAVFDHVDGGFHRYTVDDRWRVPHFEKMLNDNALMVRLITQLWQVTGAGLFAARVAATIGWLLREMRLADGAFAASMAADTGGVEGGFYLWSREELAVTLGDRSEAFFKTFEAVTEAPLQGRFVLIRVRDESGGGFEDEGPFAVDLAWLRDARARRERPLRDDKCLADWNGLAIVALAEAGVAFERPEWVVAAKAAFAAVLERLAMGSGLSHSAGGSPPVPGLLDDYAAMMQAALALHQATCDAGFLGRAMAWDEVLYTSFWDAADGGYFLTATDAERRIPRQKLVDETASPAGNGIMLGVLARLHARTHDDRFRLRFEGILRCFAGRMSRARLQAATALCNSQALEAMTEIVIAGNGALPDRLRQAVVRTWVPDSLMFCVCDDSRPPGAYVCRGQSCLPPAFSAESLAVQLRAVGTATW